MDKKYCDLCGKPTEKSYVGNNKTELQGERLRIVLTVSLDGKFSGDVCRDCLVKEIETGLK
jgi:hypothetical protein